MFNDGKNQCELLHWQITQAVAVNYIENLIASWGVSKCSIKNFQFTLRPAGRLFLIKAQTREPDYWTFSTFFRGKTEFSSLQKQEVLNEQQWNVLIATEFNKIQLPVYEKVTEWEHSWTPENPVLA